MRKARFSVFLTPALARYREELNQSDDLWCVASERYIIQRLE